MPPKPRLSKKERKAQLAAAKAAGGTEGSDSEGGEDGVAEVTNGVAEASIEAERSSGGASGGGSTARAADADASTVASEAPTVGGSSIGLSIGGASGGRAAGGASGGGAAADVDDEEMGGEEQHKLLMKSAMDRVNVTTSTYQDKIHPNARDVRVQNLCVILKGKELLMETDLVLNWGRRYGLVGPNGCGKSILMTLIGKRMVPLPKNLDLYHLTSEVEPSDQSALEAVMAVDEERKQLEAAAAELEEMITGEDTPEQEALTEHLNSIYERLEDMGADMAEARASQILFGLGFDGAMQKKRCRDFSGGWRMRVALARALFLGPSLLLLDEPTNHLDMEAVVWLERYLSTFNKILLMVSHSQDFMNGVCTNIIRMHQKKLTYYGGNYDTYIQTRQEMEEAQMTAYGKQQAEIAHIKDFVSRFGHGTRKMAQQAQSREKVLAKMAAVGLVEKVETDKVLKMKWSSPGKLPPPVLMLANVRFGYPGGKQLYDCVDFGVDLDSRIALVGPNGAGKTTLLKLMAGELIPTSGAVRPHPHLRMARYTQHFVDTLDLSMTPLDFFCKLYPDTPLAEQRSRLGRFGVGGDFQTQIMEELSDGIKSRVVFAQMAARTPHILLLDEPTNHLDMETIDSLAAAINAFEGGVVLVSHDLRLISQVAKDIYNCENGKVERLAGDILSYKAALASKLEKAAEKFEKDRRAAVAAGKGI